MTFGLDLLEEYAFPQPMPEDTFYDYHIDHNLASLILATEGTGMYLYHFFAQMCLLNIYA